MKDETIEQALRRLVVDDQLDPDVAADKALESVTRAKLAAFVRPLVVLRAKDYSRSHTRRIEARAFGRDETSSDSDDDERMTSAEARAELVRQTFAVPGKGFVPWGEATAEDHAARALWQRGQAAQCVTDAVRHEAAVALIDQHGATCLDDIDGWPDLLGEA